MKDSSVLDVLDLGLRNYQEVWNLQRELVDKRLEKGEADKLLLVEHDPPVVTVGRRGEESEWIGSHLPIFHVERGGKSTYHGKGQLVGYPIVYLSPEKPKLRQVLRCLEETLISTLSDFGLNASTKEGLTGVWIGEKKIASIGIGARRWVTYHGFALNVNPDMEEFKKIQPCGLSGDVMISMKQLLAGGELPSMDEIKEHVVSHFMHLFGYRTLQKR